MNPAFIKELRKIVKEEQCYIEELMNSHTTFRVGGPADCYVRPSVSQLPDVIRLCTQYQMPWMVIGNGSNLLVSDKGIRGLVIELGKKAEQITVEDGLITAEAGAMLSAVSRSAAQAGLTGMEFASGIPGSIGGAVVMNAGAYGGQMKDVMEGVSVLTAEGQTRNLTLEELNLGYRSSCILENKYIVLKAYLRLAKGEPKQIEGRMKELRNLRVNKQPLEYPSAGSTFKRPEGYFAGKLIQDAGLRGYQIGGAQIAEKHCGFVINRESATAADVCRLIRDVQDKVEAQSGVRLEPEVKFIGEF